MILPSSLTVLCDGRAPGKQISGFTLIETAVVLMILGFILGGLLTALGQTTENNRRADARALLQRVEEALYGYAQANGRLPCPATETSNGAEALNSVAEGDCTAKHGFVPASTLGLQGRVNSNGLLLDPWSNPLRYSVGTMGSGAPSVTSKLGMQNFFSISVPTYNETPTGMLGICVATPASAQPCSTTTPIVAPAAVVSMGANWATSTAADEVSNGGTPPGPLSVTTTNTFVSREYNELTFDDQIVWLSMPVLFSRMIQAGQLP